MEMQHLEGFGMRRTEGTSSERLRLIIDLYSRPFRSWAPMPFLPVNCGTVDAVTSPSPLAALSSRQYDLDTALMPQPPATPGLLQAQRAIANDACAVSGFDHLRATSRPRNHLSQSRNTPLVMARARVFTLLLTLYEINGEPSVRQRVSTNC